MSFAEALDYLHGQDRRYRQQWEMTRLLSNLVYKVLSSKDLELEFPWDTEGDTTQPEDTSAEDLARLRAIARHAEAAMNKVTSNQVYTE